jgi:putative ABC transport system ATP-binding protein
MTPLFETRGLCKYYKAGSQAEVRAVDDVSMRIARGDFVVLAGPSGSGKTTLLALLGALERPTRGQVFFDGRDLGPLSDVELARVRRRLGFVFQDFSLLPALPAWENITYPLIPRGLPRRQRFELAGTLLTQLGLADKLLVHPRELSGGEQQRVALARALAGQPEALLADEPTSNLDRESAQTLLELLRKQHEQGTTVVVSSHDADIVKLAGAVHELRLGALIRATNERPF